MNIHWKIPFVSLRSGILYMVNVYDPNYSGTAITLKGGAEPFTTEEDSDDDMFCDIRTHTGYLRIVDDGKDAGGNAFNWKTLVPTTDTDRPITLTHQESGSTVVDWQGFMQAQNFSGELFINRQEREYPIQCALSVLQGSDIDISTKTIQNFAYLLRECVNNIDVLSGGTISNHVVTSAGAIHIDEVWVQAGVDGRRWLLKRVDWQNYVREIEDEYEPKYTLYEILQDICKFWGWTARTDGKRLYLSRADDLDLPTWAVLTRAQLDALAGGTDASSIASFDLVTLNGNEFASIDNDDFRQRGHNKAIVKADGNGADENVIEFNDKLEELMADQGVSSETYTEDDKFVNYSNDLLSFNLPLLTGSARDTYASFAIGQIAGANYQPTDQMKMIRIKKSYSQTPNAYATLTTVYHHLYSNGFMVLKGDTYRRTTKLQQEEHEGHAPGAYHMYMKIGVGKTRGTAVWYDSDTNSWSNLETLSTFTIGNTDANFYAAASAGARRSALPTPDAEGLLFIEFYGSDDLSDLDGEKSFEISDFHVEYYWNPYRPGALRLYEKINLPTEMEYSSQNQNKVRDEWNADCIYASNNDMAFGYGMVINPDGTFMQTAVYGSQNLHPEQVLADRVTAYWQVARRMISADLLAHLANVKSITPQKRVTLDSTQLYPIAISHSWRDDIKTITFLELPT